LNRGSIVVTF